MTPVVMAFAGSLGFIFIQFPIDRTGSEVERPVQLVVR